MKSSWTLFFILFSLFSPAKPDDGSKADSWWNLREGDVVSLQNKKFPLAKKFFIGTGLGSAFDQSYVDSFILRLNGGYYLTENLALEARSTIFRNKFSEDYKNITLVSGLVPFIRRRKISVSLGTKWSPVYAKANIFSKIIYFDIYLTGLIGLVQYEDNRSSFLNKSATNQMESSTGFNYIAGIGTNIHITSHLKLNFDLEFNSYQGRSGVTDKKGRVSNVDLLAGFIFLF